MLAGRVMGQSYTTMYTFTGGGDGALPYGGLILFNNTPFGTTELGHFQEYDYEGSADMFALNMEDTTFRPVKEFAGSPFLYAGVILSSNTLYGTASEAGSGEGTVYAVNVDGSGFTNLHSFAPIPSGGYTNSDGANPWATLILSGSTLYGTAWAGGLSGNGTIFALQTDATGFTNLHLFTGGDGSHPFGSLILSGNTLYGTTQEGGTNFSGTVFAVKTDGTGFTNLYNFTEPSRSGFPHTNSDGANPQCGLILSGNTLYGTAPAGGTGANGTVFAINTDGSGFTNLHNFAAGGFANFYGNLSNSDGAAPFASLVLEGNTLYGTTTTGSSAAAGTIFALNTDGTGFTNLYSFTATSGDYDYPTNSDGANPYGVLVLSGKTFFGTAHQGGHSGFGTIFSLTLPTPPLSIAQSGTNVILSWPTPDAGYTLQCSTGMGSGAAWSNVLTQPVLVNGLETVTNPICGTQMFYRLSQ